MSDPALDLGRRLASSGQLLAVAESCTGGLLAKRITDVAGSSGWFERGLITYSNRAKQELLGVPPEILDSWGAVSQQMAEAMARGLMVMTPADWGIAVTGIAGPGGGSFEKPVGLVWLAWIRRGQQPEAQAFQFAGDREQVRAQAADTALAGLLGRLTA